MPGNTEEGEGKMLVLGRLLKQSCVLFEQDGLMRCKEDGTPFDIVKLTVVRIHKRWKEDVCHRTLCLHIDKATGIRGAVKNKDLFEATLTMGQTVELPASEGLFGGTVTFIDATHNGTSARIGFDFPETIEVWRSELLAGVMGEDRKNLTP